MFKIPSRRRFINQSIKGAMGFTLSTRGRTMAPPQPLPISQISKTDTHVHLFDLDQFNYSWLKNVPEINRNFNLHDFDQATERSNVTEIIFMESGADPEFNIREAQWVAKLADQDLRIKGIIAKLDLAQGDQTEREFSSLLELKLVKGIRGPFPQNEQGVAAFIEGLSLLLQHQLTFDLLLTPSRLPFAASVIKEVPDNVFILDHLGNPSSEESNWHQWQNGIDALAELPNVHCKISGIITRFGEAWSIDQIRPYLGYVMKHFGPDRLVYGGDWPVVLRAGSYQSWSRAFDQIMNEVPEAIAKKVCHENANRIYRL